MRNDDDPLEQAEILIARGRPGEAAAKLRTLIDSGRAGLLARLAYGRALAAAGEKGLAVETARDTVSLYSGMAPAALGLGEALLAAEMLPAAIAEFQRALRLDSGLDDARFRLAEAWLAAGEPERALEALRTVDLDHAGDPGRAGDSHRRLTAQAEAMRGQARCDAGYVRHLFDQFSADYDLRMQGMLAYRGPQILRQLADLVGLGFAGHTILDLGCGTGLAGLAFKNIAARLDGIDLSPAMIARARARGVYDELIVGDLETALAPIARRYDLIVAADTLVYLGDLTRTFEACAGALEQGGTFLFTVERGWKADFELGPKRRWRHSEAYLRMLAAACGYEIAGLVTCSPRREAGRPVEGLAAALTRKGGLPESGLPESGLAEKVG